MTREEIKYASKDYVNYLLDKQEYHNENYTEDDIRQAFEKGVVFANNNLDTSSLWQKASEEPKCGKAILCLNKKGSINLLTNNNKLIYTLVQMVAGVDKWAYINDLLPKQFGNSKQVKGGEQ